MERKLVFRNNPDKYDRDDIEVGYYAKANDGHEFFSSILDILPSDGIVMTDCGDTYMDYSIDFDVFLEVAEMIKSLRKERAEDIKQKILRKENK